MEPVGGGGGRSSGVYWGSTVYRMEWKEWGGGGGGGVHSREKREGECRRREKRIHFVFLITDKE